MNRIKSSYSIDDVMILLKDITGMVSPQPTQERERLIQSGVHYCEMLPIEYKPSAKYMEAYQEALKYYAKPTADAIAALAEKVKAKYGDKVVLVSLARAGIPIGILLKRYLSKALHIQAPHYAISIIRGRGIDDTAMHYILERHHAENLLFVDGWIGKGAILGELKKCLTAYPGVSPELAVVADPAYITELCGTHQDILVPSSCLNCTVSGLISRTFLRSDIIHKHDFHGAVYYGELADADLSYAFIHAIEAQFPKENKTIDNNKTLNENKSENASEWINTNIMISNGSQIKETSAPSDKGIDEVERIAAYYGINDINLIKPGIGETTRVLLRRVPWRVLIQQESREDKALNHIFRLAKEKGVPIAYYPLQHYKACGIIKKIADA